MLKEVWYVCSAWLTSSLNHGKVLQAKTNVVACFTCQLILICVVCSAGDDGGVVMAHYHRRQHRASAYYALLTLHFVLRQCFVKDVNSCGSWELCDLKLPPTCDHKGLYIGGSVCVCISHASRHKIHKLPASDGHKLSKRIRSCENSVYMQRIIYGPVAIYKTIMLAVTEDTAIGNRQHQIINFVIVIIEVS